MGQRAGKGGWSQHQPPPNPRRGGQAPGKAGAQRTEYSINKINKICIVLILIFWARCHRMSMNQSPIMHPLLPRADQDTAGPGALTLTGVGRQLQVLRSQWPRRQQKTPSGPPGS